MLDETVEVCQDEWVALLKRNVNVTVHVAIVYLYEEEWCVCWLTYGQEALTDKYVEKNVWSFRERCWILLLLCTFILSCQLWGETYYFWSNVTIQKVYIVYCNFLTITVSICNTRVWAKKVWCFVNGSFLLEYQDEIGYICVEKEKLWCDRSYLSRLSLLLRNIIIAFSKKGRRDSKKAIGSAAPSTGVGLWDCSMAQSLQKMVQYVRGRKRFHSDTTGSDCVFVDETDVIDILWERWSWRMTFFHDFLLQTNQRGKNPYFNLWI